MGHRPLRCPALDSGGSILVPNLGSMAPSPEPVAVTGDVAEGASACDPDPPGPDRPPGTGRQPPSLGDLRLTRSPLDALLGLAYYPNSSV